MKTAKILLVLLFFGTSTQGPAQFLKRLKDRVEWSAKTTVERKVGQKTDQVTEKTFDSVFNNNGEQLQKKKRAPASVYTFTHFYAMDLVQDDEITPITYYLTNTGAFMGSKMDLGENQEMLTILDLPKKTAYNLMNLGGSKTMISFAMDFEAVRNDGIESQEINVHATGNTKDILGYSCDEYQVEGKDYHGTFWVTQETDVRFSDAFALAEKQQKNQSYNHAWFSLVEGLPLEMNMTDTSKKKPKTFIMKCTAVGPKEVSVDTTEYEKTF